jgi:2-furoyl-CoA dehydrogenase large subunit
MTQATSAAEGWVGKSVLRKEDEPLLTGRGRFIDDLEPVAGIRHAAILRSPHPHANILGIDVSRAEQLPGVIGVVTGAQIAKVAGPIPSVVKARMKFNVCALDKVRYMGEPVAVVVAANRYIAEDALELITVDYEPLQGVAFLEDAIAPGAPLLYAEAGSNIAQERSFNYGDPDAAFARAGRVFRHEYRYPRSIATPMETYGVIANFEPRPDRYTVWANFQGPFVLQPLMAASLNVSGNRLRVITPPNSGGSFGIKQAVFGYMVLMSAASRLLGVPVKWTEDRLEHLMASSSATDRIGSVEGAFSGEGELLGLRFRNVVNLGAYIRAPEPASVYRMHATSNGAYRVKNIAIENVLVVTNRTPAGLNRGYGGPQFYFALERLMDMAARGLELDAAEIRRRNLVRKDEFPYSCPAGSVLDSGDYERCLAEVLRLADYPALLKARDAARQSGKLFGIGFALGVEPSGSNMAYVGLAQTAEQRGRAEPKSGANASATISIDPSGSVSVHLDSTPNGQGHETVAAQIVAAELGLSPGDIDVFTELDTRTAAWSIASGNYSNRFASAVSGAILVCAQKVADKLKAMAAEEFNAPAGEIALAGGSARLKADPARAIAVGRLAARAHWNPAGMPGHVSAGLHEIVVLDAPMLTSPDDADRVASAMTFGFVADLAAIELDRATGRVEIVKYASVHDVGTILNPMIVEGQIHGGFAHGLGAALFEELVHDRSGNFVSGTFAEYLCPTAPEMPELLIGHVSTPSPANRTGAKGMGDGSSMLAPAALANAAADALGRDDVELPLSLNRIWELANGMVLTRTGTYAAKRRAGEDQPLGGGALEGEGSVDLDIAASEVWRRLLDAEVLAAVIPGCRKMERSGPDGFEAEVTIGIGGIRGVYAASIRVAERREARSLRMDFRATGRLGHGRGSAWVELSPQGAGTRLAYRYAADVGGTVAAVGSRMLGSVTRVVIGQFFKAFEQYGRAGARSGRADAAAGGQDWIDRLLNWLRGVFGR